jgi:sulfur carrier protein ThiS
MIIYLRSGGKLRDRLKPDVDQYTRRVEVDGNPTIRDILAELDIPEGLVAFAFAEGKLRRLDYQPVEEEIVTLQPPVSGG